MISSTLTQSSHANSPIEPIKSSRLKHDSPELIGRRFGRLIVKEVLEKRNNIPRVRCQCDCGKYTDVDRSNLLTERTKSCGCLRIEKFKARITKHGYAGIDSPKRYLLNLWGHIKSKCNRPADVSYKNYGERGIKVSPYFKNMAIFVDYVLSHIGDRPTPDHSLDRINNDGDYEPGNLRWATRSQQQLNRRPRSEWKQSIG